MAAINSENLHDKFTESPLHCFCNNIGVIMTASEILTQTINRPNGATSNDRYIYLAIGDAVKKCTPLQPSFVHVLGHQEWQRPKKNANANQKAEHWVQQMGKAICAIHLSSIGNLAIPGAQPHLTINGKIIHRKFILEIQNATSALAYQQYLHSKLHWTIRDANDVHWNVLQLALRPLHPNNQQCIVIFINDKLPLRASKAHPHHSLLLCPSCQWAPEDEWYFLKCTHTVCQTLFNKFKGNLI